MKFFRPLLVVLLVVCFIGTAHAGAPFNNLEGVGGCGFNPFAYPGGSKIKVPEKSKESSTKSVINEVSKYVGMPQAGVWYTVLPSVNVNWFATGVSDVIMDRLEISYGYEAIWQRHAATHNQHNIGTKFLVVPENFNNFQFMPALSIGAIYKNTDNVIPGSKHYGWDGYLVATKMITQLPRPVIISGGALITNAYVLGAFGYDDDSVVTGFANADLVLTDQIIVGGEFKQGAHFQMLKNANYWNIHAAWMVNKDLTLVTALMLAGDYRSRDRVGLGNGFTVSAQYAF